MNTTRMIEGCQVTTPQQALWRDAYSTRTSPVRTWTASMRVPSNTPPAGSERVS